MNSKKLFNTLSAILIAFVLVGCKKTPSDFTINFENYQSKENPVFPADLLIAEGEYINTMVNDVEPYLEERITKGYLHCESGNDIYYDTLKADNSTGLVVIFHGFSENTSKYNEQSYYFLNMGYDVVRFEHHGHGHSTRLTENLSKVFTNNFDSYVNDADEIIQKIAVPMAEGKPLYLYAHSMGGGIATYYLELHPQTFTKAVLNCPMIGINCGKYGEPVTHLIASVMNLFGKSENYIPGGTDYTHYPDLSVAPKVGETVSPERKLYHKVIAERDTNYQTSGATYGWTLSSVNASRKFRSAKMASKIETPVLMFQSQNDIWVAAAKQNEIRGKSDKITLAYYPQLEHELFSAQNKYLYEYYDQILTFFKN